MIDKIYNKLELKIKVNFYFFKNNNKINYDKS